MRSKGHRRPNDGDTPEATVVRGFTMLHTPLLWSQRPRDSPNCQRQIHTGKRLKHRSTRETDPSTSLCRSYSRQRRFLVLVSCAYAPANCATTAILTTVQRTSATPIGFPATACDAKRDCLRSNWLFVVRIDVDTIQIGFVRATHHRSSREAFLHLAASPFGYFLSCFVRGVAQEF
jgi:hypothetical protein